MQAVAFLCCWISGLCLDRGRGLIIVDVEQVRTPPEHPPCHHPLEGGLEEDLGDTWDFPEEPDEMAEER